MNAPSPPPLLLPPSGGIIPDQSYAYWPFEKTLNGVITVNVTARDLENEIV